MSISRYVFFYLCLLASENCDNDSYTVCSYTIITCLIPRPFCVVYSNMMRHSMYVLKKDAFPSTCLTTRRASYEIGTLYPYFLSGRNKLFQSIMKQRGNITMPRLIRPREFHSSTLLSHFSPGTVRCKTD